MEEKGAIGAAKVADSSQSQVIINLTSPLLENEQNETKPRRRETVYQLLRRKLKKFFWEGQKLENPEIEIHPDADFIDRFLAVNRKYVAFLTPVIVMHTLWWLTAFRFDWFSLFANHWQLPVTMVFGSTVAGMTSEGGGAVAFPVMTLLLHIAPSIARDFSLIIQSFGMTCASFVVLFMGIQFEKKAVLFGSLGSLPGFIIGSVFLDPYLDGPMKKMLFVSIWSSFAIALYLLNQQSKRETFPCIKTLTAWKAVVLVFTGFVGGVFTSFAGSGVDICVFSILTLLFRITEKTATPTTVLLMAFNSQIGVYYRAVWVGDVEEVTWNYIKCSIPVAVLFAPFGSFLGSHFHRKVLASVIYVLEGLAIIGFLITNPPLFLILIGAAIMIVSFFLFKFITRAGQKLLEAELNETSKVTKDAATKHTC